MTIYAYLRVSTDKQDVDNQRHGLLEYANTHKLVPLEFREDTVSSKIRWRERGIGKILAGARAGDVILAAEVSRLARSTLQVLEILEHAAEKGVSVHIVKNRMVMDGSIQSRITATVLGLAAEIEREFISARTVEALARRKAQGLPLGRPKGAKAKKVKLDEHRETIVSYLKKGVSKLSIAKIIECSPSTLYAWIDRNRLESYVRRKGQTP
jgi:DNA invertase Pin-like site-specific DNA recombinase